MADLGAKVFADVSTRTVAAHDNSYVAPGERTRRAICVRAPRWQSALASCLLAGCYWNPDASPVMINTDKADRESAEAPMTPCPGAQAGNLV